MWHRASYFVVNDNICDNITLIQMQALSGFYKNGEKETDAERIDYIVKSNYIVVDGYRVNCFISAPCRRCHLCLDSRRSEYEARSIIEACDNPWMYFFTLTYDEDHIRPCGLYKRDVSDFLKRFRINLTRAYSRRFNVSESVASSAVEFRCVYVGEYGANTHRPHYHGILFFKNHIPDVHIWWLYEIFHSSWPHGIIDDFQLVRSPIASSRYICKYITKQFYITVPEGKNPCFFQGPHKCGLGAYNLEKRKEDILKSKNNCIYATCLGDVIKVRIPKFLLEKVFPSVSRTFGCIPDLFFELDNIRNELLLRNELDPFTHAINPCKYDDILFKYDFMRPGSRIRCSKRLIDFIKDDTGVYDESEAVPYYFSLFSDEELNEWFLSILNFLTSNFPTEESYFSYYKEKIRWLNNLELDNRPYPLRLERKEKKVFNNENYVHKRMLNENFDVSLCIN